MPMFKYLIKTCLMGLFIFISPAAWASSFVPPPPQIAAKSYILIDAESGYVIAEKDADTPVPPASLTKLMTAYIVESQLQSDLVELDDEVIISEKAWRTGGSRMFVQEGKNVKLEDLLRGIIIQSGNDASVAIAEYIAGSEEVFASLMNQQAVDLGMTKTRFANSTGLPSPQHYSTARDLSILSQSIINDFPDLYSIYSEKEFTYNKIRQPNRNVLLWRNSSVDGLKTGHTSEAGYCLVASSKKDNQRLISVLLGAESSAKRFSETQKLLAYGARFFETHTLYDAEEIIDKTKVWSGEKDFVALTLKDNLVVTVPKGQANNIKAKLAIIPNIEAPIEAGQELGFVEVRLDGELIKEVPVLAAQSVVLGGFLKRIWDKITRFVMG